MATQFRHSDFEDPFRDFSLLSLFPQTLGVSFDAGTAVSETQELGSIQSLFKSMALKGSTQLLEQAHTIHKSYPNIQSLYTEDGDKGFAKNGKDPPQGRRPALGRKRPHFSLKPMSSHALPDLAYNSSIDHIDDPEEYFLAFEQLENAEKELKKLRGEDSTALTHHHQSTTARKRRPGLLGKTASYKHLFPSNAYTAEAFVESQEPPDRRISSPSKTSTDMELSNVLHSRAIDEPGTSQAKKTNSELLDAADKEGSVADKEKKIDNLLGKLLSSFRDLDGDEGRTFLQESLQIKQIDVGKICLPVLGSIQRMSGSVFSNRVTGGKLEGSQIPQNSPFLSRIPLAAISTLQRHISLKDPLKDFYSLPPSDDVPSSGNASLSKVWDRDASLSKVWDRDSLSLTDINNNDKSSLIGDSASSTLVETGKQLSFEDEMHSPVVEANRTTGSKINSEEELTEHPPRLLEKNTNHNSSRLDNSKEVVSSGHDGRLQEEAPYSRDSSLRKVQDQDSLPLTDINNNDKSSLIGGIAYSPVVETGKPLSYEGKMHSPVLEAGRTTGSKITSEEELTEHPRLLEKNTNHYSSLQEEGSIMQLEPLITDHPVAAAEVLTLGSISQSRTEGLASPPSRNIDPNCNTSGINVAANLFGLDDTLQSEVNALGQKQVSDAEASKDGSSTPKATVLMDGHLESIVLPEETNEAHQTASGASLNRGRKEKAPPRRQYKKKVISRRQSLAGAGLEWKSGLRRSSRIRSRPLQYWLGERFLYGRIHDSLATVIGVKYASPAKDGSNPVLKVKSYVPEVYSDLVAQAGLH